MTKSATRIQKKNHAVILAAGLQVFSQFGFRGSTLDQIAAEAGLSKPNILYYFSSKDAIYQALLKQLLEDWLEPIYNIDPDGNPVDEIVAYANRKLAMSRDFPRESRLFANEVIQGAPRIGDALSGELRDVVGKIASIIEGWVRAERILPVNGHHLIFSIWSITQHYADFEAQVRAVLPGTDPFDEAQIHLEAMLRRTLSVPNS
ncbi:MAG: TetR family transcriptional regulator C-terminal domain-containing protein [Pseudomonadota bacterium]